MPFELETSPVHLGRDGAAVVEPAFTGELAWYMAHGARHGGDGVDGRLVSMHGFSTPWTSWEMHPVGEELVLCTAGVITLIQEIDGEVRRVSLACRPGRDQPTRGVAHRRRHRVGDRGVHHRGLNTEHRPR